MDRRVSDGDTSFGNRKLKDFSLIYTENSWDDVKPSEEFIAQAQETIRKQQECPVMQEKAAELSLNAAKNWNDFYSRHESKFFKNRKWLDIEFAELRQTNQQSELLVVEVGCGVGNTLFPLMERLPLAKFVGLDFSKEAIEICRKTPLATDADCRFDVHDLSNSDLPPYAYGASIVLCIFVLSALHPSALEPALRRIYAALKPGGLLLLRDYAKYDLTQLRFKKERLISPGFYCRGDGTFASFFDTDQIKNLADKTGFAVLSCAVDNRLLVNRRLKKEMFRCWIQAKLQKPT